MAASMESSIHLLDASPAVVGPFYAQKLFSSKPSIRRRPVGAQLSGGLCSTKT